MSQYEVWCHACHVTFPPGTKTCLHCGGGMHPEPPSRGRGWLSQPATAEVSSTPIDYNEEPGRLMAIPGLPVGNPEEQTEEQPARRSLLRAGMTVVWMILLAAGYAWRACSP